MNDPTQSSSPVVHFLGVDAGAGGPFAILGIKHSECSSQKIAQARDERLTQIDQHVHRNTPGADEARLAVHTAAAQLADHQLLEELIKVWPEGVQINKVSRLVQRSKQVPSTVIQNAKMLVALSGGLNSKARKRLVYYARLKNISAISIIEALKPVQTENSISGSEYPVPQKGARAELVLEQTQLELPPSGMNQWVAKYVLLLVLLSVSIATWIYTSLPNSSISENTSPVSRATNPDAPTANHVRSPASINNKPSRERFDHYTAIIHELDRMVSLATHDHLQAEREFNGLYPVILDQWTRFPSPAIDRLGLLVSELYSRSPLQDRSTHPILETLREHGGHGAKPNPSVSTLNAALLVQLSSSQQPITNRQLANQLYQEIFGKPPATESSFQRSLVTQVGVEGVDANHDESSWWISWIDTLKAVTQNQDQQRSTLILSALTNRLQSVSGSSKSWEELSFKLVTLLSWRVNSPEREWLIRQFQSNDVSNNRLAPLTEAIAIHSSATGIDATMVLNASATQQQRYALKDRYAIAWSPKALESTSFMSRKSELINELYIQVSLANGQLQEQDAIFHASTILPVNTAAWNQIISQEFPSIHSLPEAKSVVEQVDDLSELLNQYDDSHSGFHLVESTREDKAWAERAVNVESDSELGELLSEILDQDQIGLYSARSLVYLATTHREERVRTIALNQVSRYKNNLSVMLAVDQILAEERVGSRANRVIEMVLGEDIPDRRSKEFKAEIHKRLLQMILESSLIKDHSALQIAERLYTNLYQQRLPTVHSSSSYSENQSLIKHTQEIYSSIYKAIEQDLHSHTQLTQVETELLVRLKRSRSSVHEFISYQTGIMQLLDLHMDWKYPELRSKRLDIQDEYMQRMDYSINLIDQLMQTERTLARLLGLYLEFGRGGGA